MINYLAALGEPKSWNFFFKSPTGFGLTVVDLKDFLQVG